MSARDGWARAIAFTRVDVECFVLVAYVGTEFATERTLQVICDCDDVEV